MSSNQMNAAEQLDVTPATEQDSGVRVNPALGTNQHAPAPSVKIVVDTVDPQDTAAFSSRDTVVTPDPEELTAGINAQVVTAQNDTKRFVSQFLENEKADPRLDSDNLDEVMTAWNEKIAKKEAFDTEMTRQIELDQLDALRERQHFDLGRKSRGVFQKLSDTAGNILTGVTPEENAKKLPGVGGVRGVVMGNQERMERLAKRAGLDPKDVAPLPKPQPAPQQVPDPEYPLPLKPSLFAEIKAGASKLVSSIGGFFKKLLPSSSGARKAVTAGAIVVGATVMSSGSCQKGCNGNHPGHVDVPPVATASSSASSAPSATVAQVQTPAPSPSIPVATVPNPLTSAPLPVSSVDASVPKKPVAYPPAPKLAKVIIVPKNDGYQPKQEPKVVQKPEQKPEPTPVAELQECKDDVKMKEADLDKCLVKAEDAEKLRKNLNEQLDEQKKALDKVFAPMEGPVYASISPYKTDGSKLTFIDESAPAPKDKPTSISDVNVMNLQRARDAWSKAKTLVQSARTPKDFYTAVEFMGQLTKTIDGLIADRGKQMIASVTAANITNTSIAKEKIGDIEKNSGKKVGTVTYDEKKTGPSETKSTIDIPATRAILEGSEADMEAPAQGNDPDKVIATFQKKLEYYRGLLQLNRNLDDVRVKQRTANQRMADMMNDPGVVPPKSPKSPSASR